MNRYDIALNKPVPISPEIRQKAILKGMEIDDFYNRIDIYGIQNRNLNNDRDQNSSRNKMIQDMNNAWKDI